MKLVRKYLFFLLLFLLPVNLGKHFDLDAAYISGITVDYLVPVIYVQDIVCFVLVIVWILFGNFRKPSNILKSFSFLIFFIFAVFLSFLLSEFPLTSFIYFFRLLLYSILGFYVATNIGKNKEIEFSEILPFFEIAVIYASLLGIAQFYKQESVFNNYLILGEQPYNTSLKAILKENFLGKSFIPPYSLFRHPNTFAGFLSLLLPFLWYFRQHGKNLLFWISFVLGIICLGLTFSLVAIVSFIVSMVLLFCMKRIDFSGKPFFLLPLLIVVVSLLLPLLTGMQFIKNEPSLFRRAELLNGAYSNLVAYTPFGVGIGTSTSLFRSSVFLTRDLSFFQPVHNIFVLILLESGVLALLSLLLFLYFYYQERNKYSAYLIVFYTQMCLLGSFDHYLFTMHQTLLLTCLLFGLVSLDTRHLLGKK